MNNETPVFTDKEPAHLASQHLGHLATVGPRDAPQNAPVAFPVNAELGTIDIYRPNMGGIHPGRLITWGVDPVHPGMSGRDIRSGTDQPA